jgi:hypothetical protein
MSRPRWRRALAAALLIPALLAVGEGLHHHETLAALLSPAVNAHAVQTISTHDPQSRASHWHAASVVHEDACVACSVHRAAGVTSALAFVSVLRVACAAHAYAASSRVSFARLALGSRAPPALL